MKCHCGRDLHYTDTAIQDMVEALIAARGAYIDVECDGVTYAVQRHYIALHGIKGAELSSLGFDRVER